MSIEEKRRVGERGQVTIPKKIRDKEGIEGGELLFRDIPIRLWPVHEIMMELRRIE